MKRLFIIIFLIAIVYIAFNQYLSYRRYNPADNYNYNTNQQIDVNYHDPKLVEEYYDLAFKIGNYARTVWYNEGIDVLFHGNDEQGNNAGNYYGQMIARIKLIEAKLVNSSELKKMNYSNEDIKFIEEKGISAQNYSLFKAVDKKEAVKDDSNQLVWAIQEKLIQKGYSIPLDGKFIDITEQAVKDFQKKNNLFPSGIVDELTLRLLLK